MFLMKINILLAKPFFYVLCSMVDPASVRATGCDLCSEKAHTRDWVGIRLVAVGDNEY